MESSRPRGGATYWLLAAVLLPVLNWWGGLWLLVLARDATPLLLYVPLALGLETVLANRLLRGGGRRVRPLGTVAVLLLTSVAWSCVLTLAALAVQQNALTF